MPPSFLDPAERNDLWTRGVHGPDPTIARRARALLALDQGYSLTRAAQLCDCHRTTLWNWRRRYLQDRVADSLADRGTDLPTRRLLAQRLPARAAALWELARQHRATPLRGGRLALSRRKVERLTTAARRHPDPLTRFHAAMLLAYHRGAPVTAIANAGTCCRSTVYSAPDRHLPQLLDALRHPPTPSHPTDLHPRPLLKSHDAEIKSSKQHHPT